ncbi:MAG: acyl carrier protein [Nitrospinae bacterium CG11_big_fil_rev_8_21_14_0_20_56_8]|nr:MAG: acyl carrier protein [Nitrospinae bacterium CG11_big_fil_rev_8_21_14_0_20_56_8]
MSENTLDPNQLEKLTGIFRVLFNAPQLELRDNLTAKDVAGWDSFNHVNLIISIEEEFGLRFSNDEVGSLQNVGHLKHLLASKLASS